MEHEHASPAGWGIVDIVGRSSVSKPSFFFSKYTFPHTPIERFHLYFSSVNLKPEHLHHEKKSGGIFFFPTHARP